MTILDDISKESLTNEIARALLVKYKNQAPQDANWMARDDAIVIVQNMDIILPILERHTQ
jgi:hypothetical protein